VVNQRTPKELSRGGTLFFPILSLDWLLLNEFMKVIYSIGYQLLSLLEFSTSPGFANVIDPGHSILNYHVLFDWARCGCRQVLDFLPLYICHDYLYHCLISHVRCIIPAIEVNHIAYSFETVLSDEFYDRSLAYAPSETVPNGPRYRSPAHQGCAFSGAQVRFLSIPSSRYVSTSFNYSYSRSHL
jgi:hypothetical protein